MGNLAQRLQRIGAQAQQDRMNSKGQLTQSQKLQRMFLAS